MVNKEDLSEGEWYYNKDTIYDFEHISFDKNVDVNYWYLSGNPVVVVERHPADQKTESKSIKCVFKSNIQDLTITNVKTDSDPINPDEFDSVKQELKYVEYDVLENIFVDNNYDIEDITVNEDENKLILNCYHPYEYGNITLTIQK